MVAENEEGENQNIGKFVGALRNEANFIHEMKRVEIFRENGRISFGCLSYAGNYCT